jgi:CRISPR-associated protein Cmr1
MATLLEARYRLSTPLFGGGADPSATSELRPASFKGVLRFWWRALAWSRWQGDLARIQEQEAVLFGSTSRGQAAVRLRFVIPARLESLSAQSTLKEARGDSQVVGMGARYLVGPGLKAASASRKTSTKAGQLTRPALQAPLEFIVQLRCTALDSALQQSLIEALIALGCLGGMGSRSRKGYGSLVLEAIDLEGSSHWQAPRSDEQLLETIRDLREQANREGLPPYTALSRDARHLLLSAESCREPLQLLDRIGREMVRFRSWGKDGMVLQNVPREPNFQHDHHLMKQPVGARRSHPQRIAFGLPHNYGKGASNEVAPEGQLDRRASPLFIHIHSCGSRPVAVLSFLPARFLPAATGGGPAFISVGGARVRQQPEAELYRPIHNFLDRLLDEHRCKEPFSTVQEVGR